MRKLLSLKLLVVSLGLTLLLAGQAGATQMPEEVVGANNDDGNEEEGVACDRAGNDVCMVPIHDCDFAFYRFTSIPIPQGATIDGCTLIVDVYSTTYDTPNIDIYGEDTASATTLPDEVDCISARTLTTASVHWEESDIGAGEKPSPDLKTVLQEIVDRADWESGNDLAFITVNGVGSFYADSYEEGHPAKLHCWYTTGAPPAAGQVIIIGARNEETYHNPRLGIPPVIWE